MNKNYYYYRHRLGGYNSGKGQDYYLPYIKNISSTLNISRPRFNTDILKRFYNY
jgi:hypothetical protein